MNFFSKIDTWDIPYVALLDSLSEMAVDGVEGNEGVVLWLGTRNSGHASVTHLVLLRGDGILKQPDLLTIDSSLLNEVTDLTIDLKVCLIGQIHSHGSHFGTDLSRTDRLNGFIIPSFLSVVAPDYALRKNTTIYDCGVHIFEHGYGYKRLSAGEVQRKISLSPGPALPILTVGDKL